ncbi:hypothetical protein DD237_001809 [Peronospora effusa]|nr:hypothetical protein DD237_001809 [Peronospora effusa]
MRYTKVLPDEAYREPKSFWLFVIRLLQSPRSSVLHVCKNKRSRILRPERQNRLNQPVALAYAATFAGRAMTSLHIEALIVNGYNF